MLKSNLVIALIFLVTGFVSAYLIFGMPAGSPDSKPAINKHRSPSDNGTAFETNPFLTINNNASETDKLNYLDNEIRSIKKQLNDIELTLQDLTDNSGNVLVSQRNVNNSNRFTSALSRRLYNLDSLIRGGIDPGLAEDIVRRKNSIELKRLELQDRARRENYLNSDRYFDELETINEQDVSLRQELGDDRYDEYLYNSKQNNRIKISSVMLGSAAEQAGIQSGDIVLSYDNQRMFTWQELKDATAEGELGEYVSISISRNGEIFSFSVPRGALGMQLGATRLTP